MHGRRGRLGKQHKRGWPGSTRNGAGHSRLFAGSVTYSRGGCREDRTRHAGNPPLAVAIRGFVLSIVLDKRRANPGRWTTLTDVALAEALAKMPLLGSDLKDLEPVFGRLDEMNTAAE